MAPSEMASMSPPPAYSLGARDDTEVLSRRTAPKGGAHDVVREAPQGGTSTTGHMGEPSPMEAGEEGASSSALSRIRFRGLIWLRSQASSPL